MSHYFSQVATAVVLVLASAAIAMIGIVFLAGALYLALVANLPPALAALLTGLAVLATALIVIAIARLALHPPRHAQPPAGSAASGEALDPSLLLGEALGSELVNCTRAHPYGSMLAALAAGFAFGASPGLRKTLQQLLQNAARQPRQ